MAQITCPWPPPYRIRKSVRAKRVLLQISNESGLEIIVPESRIRQPNISALLEQKRRWIEKNLISYLSINATPIERPLELNFLSVHHSISLHYQKTEKQRILLQYHPEQSNTSVNRNSLAHCAITGPIDDISYLSRVLRSFVKKMAVSFLSPWLQQLSQETHLPYSSVTFRNQSTLWGSCTAKQKISLNTKLLFLPEVLTRYVLLHELCHTVHLNHSKRYWNLLKQFDPLCFTHRKLLRTAGQYIPNWFEH